MHLSPRTELWRRKEYITMACRVGCHALNVSLKFLIITWTSCENICRREVRVDAFDVTSTAGSEREAKPVRFWVHLDKSLNGPQRHQNSKSLIELLNYVECIPI